MSKYAPRILMATTLVRILHPTVDIMSPRSPTRCMQAHYSQEEIYLTQVQLFWIPTNLIDLISFDFQATMNNVPPASPPSH